MKLLLIDIHVKSHKIINSRKNDVDYIIFDSFIDTYLTLLQKISEKNEKYSDIALIQHHNLSNLYRILYRETPLKLNEESPYISYSDFLNFLKELTTQTNLQRFDMLACSLYYHINFKNAVQWLEEETGIDLRASSNFTGNSENGGDWIMESDNIDIRENYFTNDISNFNDLLYNYSNASMYGANKIIKDICGNFIYLHKDIYGRPINPQYNLSSHNLQFPSGSVALWGDIDSGGSNNTGVDLSSGVVAIYSTRKAFAALKADGSVVLWGDPDAGGTNNSDAELSSGVIAIYSTLRAFAALRSDGSVVTWGDRYFGADNSTTFPHAANGVIEVYSNHLGFIALKSDGSALFWGATFLSDLQMNLYDKGTVILNSGAVAVYSTDYAFAILKSDGSVILWGDHGAGGSNNTGVDLSSDVFAIYSNALSFAALKSNGSVVLWGNTYYGGSNNTGVDLSSGVVAIYSTYTAFAALKSDGSVVLWGDIYTGGSNNTGVDLSSGVISIYATGGVFSALKSDGSIVAWGEYFRILPDGASFISPIVGVDLSSGIVDTSSNVVAIYSNHASFAGLKSDGSIILWGPSAAGGSNNTGVDLSSGIVAIYSMGYTFAALKSNGSVVIWGNAELGGNNNTGVDLSSGVIAIYSTDGAFATLKPSQPYNLTDYYYSTGAHIFKEVISISASMNESSIIVHLNSFKNLSIIITSGTPPFTYTWYKDNIQLINETFDNINIYNDYLSPDVPITSIYKCIITDINSITLDLSAIVTFEPYTSLTATALNPNPIASVGETIELSLNVANGKPEYTYLWTLDGCGNVLSTSPFIYINNDYLTLDISLNQIYRCAVKDSLNLKTVDVIFNVTIAAYFLIDVSQNIYFANVDIGDSITLSYVNLGIVTQPLNHEWYISNDNLSYTLISEETQNKYLIVNNGTYDTNAIFYYKLIIKDANNKIAILKPYIIQLLSPVIGTITSTLNVLNASQQSTIIANVSGGLNDYTFQWYEILPDGTNIYLNDIADGYIYSIENNILIIKNMYQYENDINITYKCIIKNK
jgi:hypothetical protein